MIGKAINLKVKAKPYLYPKFVEYFIQKKEAFIQYRRSEM